MPSPFPLRLFADIMQETPAQPATNLWRAVELKALMEQALPRLRDCRDIFDLGCGDGGIMAVLRPALSAEANLTGLDPDPAETQLAAGRGLYTKVITSGAECMPLEDASIDAIISNSVFEHIEPIDQVLIESARVLRPGGWFVATVPGPDFHRCLYGAWLPWVKRDAYLRQLDKRLAHFRYWTAEEWRQYMNDADILLTETRAYLPFAVVRRWELLSRLTGGLLYYLTGGKTPPIGLQRKMNLRRRSAIPPFLIRALSWILSCGLDRKNEGPYGALLLIGRKASSG